MPNNMPPDNINVQLARNFKAVVGARLRKARAMRPAENEGMGFPADALNPTVVLEFDNGYALVLTADPEGNGPGWAEVVELEEKKSPT